MPKIGDLVSQLQINGKTFQNPEWWSTTHKLKRNVKNIEFIKANSKLNLKTSYQITEPQASDCDTYVKNLRANFDLPKYKEYAPWNPIFRKTTPIILFKKP